MATFGFAIIIAFLTLAALYESFRDPLVILISVPLSIAGALIFIAIGIGGATLNIYTQVGLVTLIGLISKHGILIVEVANEEQQSGKIQARGHRHRGGSTTAADLDDHGGHGARRGAVDLCARRRRRFALRHRTRSSRPVSGSARCSPCSWCRRVYMLIGARHSQFGATSVWKSLQ